MVKDDVSPDAVAAQPVVARRRGSVALIVWLVRACLFGAGYLAQHAQDHGYRSNVV